MCGRFALFSTKEQIEEQYQFSLDEQPTQRYNIAPTNLILAIVQDKREKRQAKWFRWGLIPFWAKDPSIGNRLINARGETLAQKPSFRHLLKRRRCLILTNGFFEWKKQGTRKQPYFIRRRDQTLFTFAGLWDCWQNGEQKMETCTIITTEANSLMKPIHHRMPVIFDAEREEQWLDPKITDQEWLRELLTPFDAQRMELYPVSPTVNNPRNDDPDMVQPISI
mgnify:CR=1 FL=1